MFCTIVSTEALRAADVTTSIFSQVVLCRDIGRTAGLARSQAFAASLVVGQRVFVKGPLLLPAVCSSATIASVRTSQPAERNEH